MGTTLRVLGVIEAGFPTSASEELIDTISLDEYLIGNKEATYLLKVTSRSMEDAGILQGDMVIVERGRDPKKNDIVIVEKDGSYSMMHFSDIGSEASVAAVITAVVRRY
ncbi:MAG: lexA [Parcubacteria group bacterium]|nr:lexA [Parcubacteria group bacterium]